MKAILIDPAARIVREVEHTGGLKSLYNLLDCTMVEAPIVYDNEDAMYCDEQAWINVKPKDTLSGFMFPEWSYPILGKALIVGTDEDGEDCNCKSTLEDFTGIVWKDDTEMSIHGMKIGML